MIALLSLLISGLVCLLILASERWHGRFTADEPGSGPQKIHTSPTPRVGGVAIFFGLLIASGYLAQSQMSVSWWASLIGALAIPFAFGLHEDITGRASPSLRLLGTALAAIVAFALCGIGLVRFDVPGFDALLTVHWSVALAFSVFCVCAIAHAYNLVDGLNGLLALITLVSCAGLAFAAKEADDALLYPISLALVGAIVGFLCFNFPHARLFAGDSGAYVLGTAISLLAMLLIARNPGISPWYVFALVLYPFSDTCTAIIRRVRRKQPISQADAEHLHSLLARIPVPWLSSGTLGHWASPIIASVSLLYVGIATQFMGSTPLLMALAGSYFALYATAYLWARRSTSAAHGTPIKLQ